MEAHLNIGNLTQGSFALYVSGRRLSYVKVLGEGVMVQFAISPQLGSRFAKEGSSVTTRRRLQNGLSQSKRRLILFQGRGAKNFPRSKETSACDA
jgi:hypothetical protein